MSLASVIDQLRERIGLDPASLGPTVIPVVVATRQRALGIANLTAYAQHLKHVPAEIEALVDELVVRETWFFRGGELFSYLAKQIQDSAMIRPAGKPFRILSVPCSTGEEPYSLAIALAELHVPRRAWHLDAVDINSAHLEKARQGRYGAFSFRQTDGELRSRHFEANGNQWQLEESLIASVQFQQGNLVDADFLREQLPYDLIFCRNLLIYLHNTARQKVAEVVDRLLAPQGLVCMGHAEPLNSIDHRFIHTGPDGFFLFCRATSAARHEPPARPLPHVATEIAVLDGSIKTKSAPRSQVKSTRAQPSGAAALPASDPLSVAKSHADAGRLDAAWAECQTQLSTNGPTAELYAMLGLIHKARQDDAESKRCFEKALYLQPDHVEAIWHLMLQFEQEGAHAQAALLRDRLQRAGGGGEA
ncbi:MAG TPA: CheR family methyltransferase [Pirellulales bacterium]|jgi:chemotaxis protein methyltransferase WspC